MRTQPIMFELVKNDQLHRLLRQARNTGMESLDLFLVDFLKREL